MPITRLLAKSTFDPEQLREIVYAYESVLASLNLTDRTDPLTDQREAPGVVSEQQDSRLPVAWLLTALVVVLLLLTPVSVRRLVRAYRWSRAKSGSTIISGTVWNARSHAAYHGYSHLSGIEITWPLTI